MLDDFYAQMVDTIATDRKLDAKKVKELLDDGIITADNGKAAGLIDMVCYDDELKAEIAKALKKDEVAYIKDYGKKQVDTDFSGFGGHDEADGSLDRRRASQSDHADAKDRRRLRRRRHHDRQERRRPDGRRSRRLDTDRQGHPRSAKKDSRSRRSCCASTAPAARPWPAI